MKALHMIAFTLVIIGALNWGLIGLFNFNLVMTLVGGWPALESLVYVLVGLSAVYLIIMHKKDCMTCSMAMMPTKTTTKPMTKGKKK